MKVEEILKIRAKNLSAVLKEDTDKSERTDILEFLLIPETYGIPVSVVSEVLPLPEFTTIPGTPGFVVGVINARGRILSVIDLRDFLHLPARGITELNKVIVVRWNQLEFGILADKVTGVREIAKDAILPAPAQIAGLEAEKITGITTEGVIILNPDSIFLNKQLIINQKK
jgi:purine-binding chemotaxis protein CheW